MANANITVVNGKLVYGMEDCYCHDGKVLSHKQCSKCHGTDRSKGGLGKGRCRYCFGGRVIDSDWNHAITCPHCKGNSQIQSDSCSYLPEGIFESLTFKVFRNLSHLQLSLADQHFAIGCVYSCTDYGDATRLTDEEVIASVRDSRKGCGSVQACKIAKDDGTLCDFIAIIVQSNGYTVRGIWQ